MAPLSAMAQTEKPSAPTASRDDQDTRTPADEGEDLAGMLFMVGHLSAHMGWSSELGSFFHKGAVFYGGPRRGPLV